MSAHSVLHQLHELSESSEFTLDELIQLHAMEGILKRLSHTEYKDEFVLRGSLLARHWFTPFKWMPSDIDFMLPKALPAKDLLKKIITILNVRNIDDSLFYDATAISYEVIWAETDKPGLRLIIPTRLTGYDKTLKCQIDISYGDPVVPTPKFAEFSCLLPDQSILIKCVAKETSAGWKLYGLFERSNERWRPKDLFGLYWLLKMDSIDISAVLASFKATSVVRDTPLELASRLFEGNFASSRNSQKLWQKFIRVQPQFNLPEDVHAVAEFVKEKLEIKYFSLLEQENPNRNYIQGNNNRFPRIESLSDILPVIQGRKEFGVYEVDGHTIIDYLNVSKYTFLNPETTAHPSTNSYYRLRRECRGLVFDPDGQLIQRKYHKFFAIDEIEETSLENISWNTECHVLEKMDGSLVSPCIWNGQIRWLTRRGPSPIADQAAEHMKQSDLPYVSLVQSCLDNNWTPLFEWCSRQHPIVLDYPEDQLVLTAIRNNFSGRYLRYEQLETLASKHNIPLVKNKGILKDIHEAKVWISSLNNEDDDEGFVLSFEDGQLYKVKNPKYVARHNLVAHKQNELYIWRSHFDNSLQQLLDGVAPQLAEDISLFSDKLRIAIDDLTLEVITLVTRSKMDIRKKEYNATEAKKAFAVRYVQKLDKRRRPLAFLAWQYADTASSHRILKEKLREHFLKYCTNRKRLEYIRPLLGLKWYDRRFYPTSK